MEQKTSKSAIGIKKSWRKERQEERAEEKDRKREPRRKTGRESQGERQEERAEEKDKSIKSSGLTPSQVYNLGMRVSCPTISIRV